MHQVPYVSKRIYPAPGSTNRVKWMWDKWLAPLDTTIEEFEVVGDGNVTVGAVTLDGAAVTAFISVPATERKAYTATCRVKTAAGDDTSRVITIVPTRQS